MEASAEAEEFERAAKYRDLISTEQYVWRRLVATTCLLHARPAREPDHARQGIRQLRRAPARVRRRRWTAVAILGKWNGAVGNFNAHVAAVPAARLAGASGAVVRRVARRSSTTTTPRRSSRTTGSPSTATRVAALNVIAHRSVPRLLGLHLARLSAPARRSPARSAPRRCRTR